MEPQTDESLLDYLILYSMLSDTPRSIHGAMHCSLHLVSKLNFIGNIFTQKNLLHICGFQLIPIRIQEDITSLSSELHWVAALKSIGSLTVDCFFQMIYT
jgi:hypothetical protein